MSVDADTVRRIAHLARIAVADSEVENLRAELNAMLAFVEQLQEVDVKGVEPMISVTPMTMKKRADVVTDGGDRRGSAQERTAERRELLFWFPRSSNNVHRLRNEFLVMIDALPPEDRERILRDQAARFECEASETPPAAQPVVDERKPVVTKL